MPSIPIHQASLKDIKSDHITQYQTFLIVKYQYLLHNKVLKVEESQKQIPAVAPGAMSNSNPSENEHHKMRPSLPNLPIPPHSCAPPHRPNQSLLNLPTEPVPQASLVQEQKVGDIQGSGQQQHVEQQTGQIQCQSVQPRVMRPMMQQQNPQVILNQPRIIGPNGGRAPLQQSIVHGSAMIPHYMEIGANNQPLNVIRGRAVLFSF